MPARPSPRLALGDVALTALAPVLWGSTYIVTTEILPPDRPFIAAVLRCAPAGALLLAAFWHRPRAGDWTRLLILSALNIGIFQSLLFVAAYRLPGGLAAVLGAIQPILVMLLAWAVDGKSPAPMGLAAAVGGTVGMALLMLAPDAGAETIGVLAALIGASSMAAGIFLTRRWRLDMPVISLTGWQLFIGGIMLLPVALMAEPLPADLTLREIGGYLYLCLAGALLAYSLWFRGIERLPPAAIASLGLLSPVTAVVLGWTVLKQVMRGQAVIGLVMVLASIALVQWSAAKES